jgi:uncharacterized protein (TIGR02058 family)
LRVDCSPRDKHLYPGLIGDKNQWHVCAALLKWVWVSTSTAATTKAAKRAVSDAIRHSSLGFVRMLGKTPHDMLVDVTIGVPNPDLVDTSAVAKELPYGTVTVKAVKGGLEIPAESGGDAITIANAAVIVSLDDGK